VSPHRADPRSETRIATLTDQLATRKVPLERRLRTNEIMQRTGKKRDLPVALAGAVYARGCGWPAARQDAAAARSAPGARYRRARHRVDALDAAELFDVLTPIADVLGR
jgi:hypothetical protein